MGERLVNSSTQGNVTTEIYEKTGLLGMIMRVALRGRTVDFPSMMVGGPEGGLFEPVPTILKGNQRAVVTINGDRKQEVYHL